MISVLGRWLMMGAMLAAMAWPAAVCAGAAENPGGLQSPANPERPWGIGGALRTATIPFGSQRGVVTSFVPLLYYEGDAFYMDGIEGGATLWQDDRWRVRALGRLRFFDIPDNLQNLIQGDTVDWGGQARYRLSDHASVQAEWLTDQHFAWHANFGVEFSAETGDLELWPYLNLRYKSARFNSTYYALDWAGFPGIRGGTDVQAGLRFRYHVRGNFYLMGGGQFTRACSHYG